MIEEIAKWIVILFGAFIGILGLIMLFYPSIAREMIRKAGSTNFINYAEITIRLTPAIAMVIYSKNAKYPEVFEIFGWIMILTSLALYIIPRRYHHQFAGNCADILKPVYLRLISPIALLLGGLIIFSTIK